MRPVGQAFDETCFETIGAAGGTIQCQDGQLTIDIPAGALKDETEIGIQRVRNTAASGIGYSYRVAPHGKIFQKKVTVRFSYRKAERRISSTKALEVAYQNQMGEWNCIGGSVNDPVQKTISVQTDHFSDWAFVASMELSPVLKAIGLNESIALRALRYVFPSKDGDFLAPLALTEAGTSEPMLLDKKYIVGWSLNGPGKLEAKGAEAVYTAPSAMPANKTATATVELNVQGRQVLLISTIQLINEGIDISIDGGPWKMYAGMAIKMPGLNKYSLGNLRLTADLPQIVFMWPLTSGKKADGTYQWSMFSDDQYNVVFEYATPDLSKLYASVYDEELNSSVDSGGFISVEEKEENGKKYLTGMFAIDQSGQYLTSTGEQIGVSSIIGTFQVQRSW
ncbi:MAG: hypothetical protein EOO10_13945 [Chitinophagaceae bacterium]|nr:MAG: hypothetical protein EOO10_13945 [Chitinophagaceae bacterium]